LKIIDILNCFDIDESPPKIQRSLLLACFAGLLAALKLRHLPPPTIEAFINAAKERWLSMLGPATRKTRGHVDLSDQTVVTIWNGAYSVLSRDDPGKYLKHLGTLKKLQHDGSGPKFPDVPLVSIQDARMFKYWLKDPASNSPPAELGLVEYGAADVVALIDSCKDPGRLQSQCVVGRPKAIVWLTPMSDKIASLIEEARRAANGGSEDRLDNLRLASIARNRLGLWKKRSPDHGIAVIMKKSYDNYVDELGPDIKAPTIFDAEGYDRFRHWPSPHTATGDDLGRGRTYELDPEIRKLESPNDGAPEVVASPRPFSEVDELVYLGRFGIPPGCDGKSDRSSYSEFANQVAGGQLLDAILAELARALNV
jgi:hypothetical protein